MGLKRNKQKGITLVALVVTIVVLLILSGITITYVMGDNSIFAQAQAAKFKTRWSAYKEQVDTYTTWKIASTMNTNISGINAGDTLKELIELEAEGVDIQPEDINTPISDIVSNIDSKDQKYVVVYHGELCYVKDDRNKDAEKEAKWCEEMGIPVLELKRPSGINIKDGTYEYVNGAYLCTPVLNEGFDKNYTRYVNENKNGVMEPKNWIFSTPTEDWYDYSKGKWANIVTENNGKECYYTWIPRYCFKLNQGSQRADVKLIDMNNNYKDPYTDEITSWDTLKSQGYAVPEAFTFNGKAIPGYWAMKYNLADAPDTNIIHYDMKVSRGVITITNIKITNGAGITKFVVNLNSKEQEVITDVANIGSKTIRLTNMKAGDNVINITGLNNKGEMLGSFTKVYGSSTVNPPDLTGFDKDSTFYVLYDEKDNEYSTVPISEEVPIGWYNYDEGEWANIVVRDNSGETYYTWIPRYEFYLTYGTTQRSEVKFITGTQGGTGTNRAGVTSGYQIPEAFKFNGKEISGYWAMKYNMADVNTGALNTDTVSTSNSITLKGLKGTMIASGQTYNYYISGKARNKDSKPDKTTKNAAEVMPFSELEAGKEYTILVEIRNSSGGYVGGLTKKVKTAEPNKPDLTGFNSACTYYVTYNGDTPVRGEAIKNDGSNMPTGWYDYSNGRWANIVTTNGETETYFTWIPRYEFRLDGTTNVQRSDVRFISGTSGGTGTNRDGVTPAYQVPEAFKFNGKEISGYWVMKYNLK